MLKDKEREYIKERSLLKGQLAQAQSREKRYKGTNSNLKLLVVLLLFLLPMSHCWFGKVIPTDLSEKNQNLLLAFQAEELKESHSIIKKLDEQLNTPPDSTFIYVTKDGDYPGSISKDFYNTPIFGRLIMNKNDLTNSRRIPIGDTIVLWEVNHFNETYIKK